MESHRKVQITFFNGSRVLISARLVIQTSIISPWAMPMCVKRSSCDSKGPREHFEHFLHKISVTESKSQTSGLCTKLKCSITVAIFSAKKSQFWKGQYGYCLIFVLISFNKKFWKWFTAKCALSSSVVSKSMLGRPVLIKQHWHWKKILYSSCFGSKT